MSASVVFNLSEAQDARNRLDDGIGRDGDRALAETYDAYLRQEWDRYWDPIHAAEAAAAQRAVEGMCHDGWHDREGDGIPKCPSCGEPDAPLVAGSGVAS